ncbi:MAG: hemin receptor [Alphaproteobacteria bacterium]|jgi:hemoglobin-like flavoprotein|nr:hemin receptor [Alphaproteobacteria bacterium]
MTPESIATIQRSWEAVTPIADQAATLFYDRLFEIDPTTRPLFRATDLAAQRRKLMDIIGTVVGKLEQIEELLPTVEALGARHVAYGVEDRHYDSVGAALLWTLEQGLGNQWTTETGEAWGQAYTLLSDVMRNAGTKATAA